MRPDSIRANSSLCREIPERRMMIFWHSYGSRMKGKNIDQVPYVGVSYTALVKGTSIPWALALDCMTSKSLLATGVRLHGLMDVRRGSRQVAGEQGRGELRAQWNELRLER
jgi:hypothetical protein